MIKQDWLTPKCEIRQTVGKGRGVFAIEPIKANEKVLVWGGQYVNKAEAEKLKAANKLVIQWDDDLFSAEDRGQESGYFINHSCDSNTWMSDTFTLTARRDIAKGEEVTVDYALFEEDKNYLAKWECHCGTAVCRKKITGNDWQLPEVQARYRGHFLPFINKRIG